MSFLSPRPNTVSSSSPSGLLLTQFHCCFFTFSHWMPQRWPIIPSFCPTFTCSFNVFYAWSCHVAPFSTRCHLRLHGTTTPTSNHIKLLIINRDILRFLDNLHKGSCHFVSQKYFIPFSNGLCWILVNNHNLHMPFTFWMTLLHHPHLQCSPSSSFSLVFPFLQRKKQDPVYPLTSLPSPKSQLPFKPLTKKSLYLCNILNYFLALPYTKCQLLFPIWHFYLAFFIMPQGDLSSPNKPIFS